MSTTHKCESPAATGLNAKNENTNPCILTETSSKRNRTAFGTADALLVDRFGNSKTYARFNGIAGNGRILADAISDHILEAASSFANRAARRQATRDLKKRRAQK